MYSLEISGGGHSDAVIFVYPVSGNEFSKKKYKVFINEIVKKKRKLVISLI